ncbi:MAG: helix-turn-helix transcriptional regulator [Youngiibacter sp.]|nr:helix-turn-helix transcriptional regulator [Youngiibacter sp.]
MVGNNLSKILGEKRIPMSKVFEDTGIARSTLHALYHEESKGIRFDTLEALCIYLGISVKDFWK